MSLPAGQPYDQSLAWAEANGLYLEAELRRLRLLIRRRVLWLRQLWGEDPLQSYQAMVISEIQADRLLAGEEPEAEGLFYRRDPRAVAVGRELEECEAELAARTAQLAKAGLSPALEVAVRLFELDDFERQVLILCLAPELEPDFERLYAYVQDDVGRNHPTPHLALALFTAPGEERWLARDSFLPQAPLRRHRLVEVESGSVPPTTPGTRPLRLPGRVADYLRGVNRPEDRLAGLLQPVSALPLTAPQRELVERLEGALRPDESELGWRVLNLVGPAGVGRGAVAWALADRLGLDLVRLETGRLPPAGPEREETLSFLAREALLLQLAVYLELESDDAVDAARIEAQREVVERLGVFLVVGSQQAWQGEAEALVAPVPRADAEAQRALWHVALTERGFDRDEVVEPLVQQFDLGPRAVTRAVAAAQGRARLRRGTGAGIEADDLWQACRELSRRDLDELGQRLVPGYGWEDIVLPADTLGPLREIGAQVALRPRVYGTWGFAARLGRGRGISALFTGPSGTGKTMAAEILAGDLELDLFRIDLAGVVSKYIGETEKNLRRVFDAAEASGAILFFDEADALFGKRTEVKDSHDRYANIEVGYLLQRMEDYRGLAILATNRRADLDRAFLRRLRFLVEFPFPDSASRRRIWRRVFPPETELAALDYRALARLEIAGGNIRNIAVNAAFLAAGDDRPVGMDHLMHAARREYAKTERIVTESEFGAFCPRRAR